MLDGTFDFIGISAPVARGSFGTDLIGFKDFASGISGSTVVSIKCSESFTFLSLVPSLKVFSCVSSSRTKYWSVFLRISF